MRAFIGTVKTIFVLAAIAGGLYVLDGQLKRERTQGMERATLDIVAPYVKACGGYGGPKETLLCALQEVAREDQRLRALISKHTSP
jgi:hypothetical protein